MATSLVGQKLGKYEISELLGQGGMATVYKGYQRDVDRFVAVKVLPPHPGLNSQFVERFRLEARTIARLQHPHILPLYDYGDENDILYLVMAYADGGSLSDLIRQGALPMAQVQRMFQQIAGALDYAHRQNVIHRDIKPDNILLDREGHALLADFGIVKLIQDAGSATLTGTGGLVGTPAYMSPEQAQGLPIDKRSDIYSLGIVLFEMLTGKQPFSAETPMQLVFEHVTTPPPLISEFNTTLTPDLDVVMQRALDKSPQNRYASVREFYDDFARVTSGQQPLTTTRNLTPVPPLAPAAATSSTTMPATPQPTVVAVNSLNPLVLLGGVAIVALVAVAIVVMVINTNRPAPTTPATITAAPPSAVPLVAQPSPVINSAPTFGTVSYATDTTPGDTINVTVRDLAPAPQGQTHTVWLHNTDRDTWLKVGSLRLDALGNGQLSYHGSPMLPVLYNAVVISDESGEGDAPSGKVVYSGSVPDEVMGALREILIASPDGIPGVTSDIPLPYTEEATSDASSTEEAAPGSSLLTGALTEAQIAMQHAGLAAQATSAGGMHTHAEHTINILNGTAVDYNGNGRGENPGRGFGIAAFTDRIQTKLDAIANAPDAERSVQNQLELVRVCLVNVQGWKNRVIELENQFLQTDDLQSVQQLLADSTQFASAIVNGIDLNQNGQVEPFEGECGLKQIADFGISAGNITIYAGDLPQGE